MKATINAVEKIVAKILETIFAVVHLVFPYLLVKMMLFTPSYSPEKTGAIIITIANDRTIKIFTMF